MTISANTEHEALAALDARRSVPAKQLEAPGPDDATLLRMLRSASRVPDHGKRVPFRFLRIAGADRDALGERLAARSMERDPDIGDGALDKDRRRFSHAPLVIVVVAVLDPEDTKIPEVERLLTAGSVCFALLQAAQALGFGGSWLSGWPAYDPEVLALLGLDANERVAGFIHIGTPRIEAPERERPDPATLLTDWHAP
ncbi:nitroreductase [Luteimonas fraxinea]|uniref:Putative NAD(P)H nitroreductase n=1 Tax=Luteimonas fraxinea TaxID=2901869 RepID=A0ABS8UB03_9GAMM|nr:nitroreductase [Luteimonas fraxinea]MCD9095921.1 nitroreductase [Luteimonas fraxinea]MCD9124510.1 nitroreductase [Luteimonas fraxinea]UHH10905.1 nitroreductase [Luteimonas fraxinea]